MSDQILRNKISLVGSVLQWCVIIRVPPVLPWANWSVWCFELLPRFFRLLREELGTLLDYRFIQTRP